jgi:AcrR family transcriptional regulator
MARPTTREKLLNAAFWFFSRRGYSGSGTREIAARARVNESTLFRTFGSKRELFRCTLEHELGRVPFSQLLDREAFARGLDPGIRSLARNFAGALRERDQLERMLHFAALEQPKAVEHFVRDIVQPFLDDLVAMLREAMARGDMLAHPAPHIPARIFIDALAGSHQFLHWFNAGQLREYRCARPEDLIANFWLRAVSADPPAFLPPR